MKKLLLVFLFIVGVSYAQIQVSVWTDKSAYTQEDTISITVTAYNPTIDTVWLEFSSACQGNYLIDDLNWIQNVVCATVLTFRKIDPLSGFNWQFRYPDPHRTFPTLSAGSHRVVGEVLGYMRSEAVTISIEAKIDVKQPSSRACDFQLNQNYPNPFNATTVIIYQIPRAGLVRMTIHDILGRKILTIVDGNQSAGEHVVCIKSDPLPSGNYWCRIKYEDQSRTRQMTVAR
ncbi:MAG: T9SS type A sorting domain-containing protein [Candidatus Neomarinimicrobiota bacterium]